MLKAVKKICKTDVSKAKYIYYLMSKGKIKRYIDETGMLCYDTEEYKAYRKTAKRGAPIKGEAIKVKGDNKDE